MRKFKIETLSGTIEDISIDWRGEKSGLARLHSIRLGQGDEGSQTVQSLFVPRRLVDKLKIGARVDLYALVQGCDYSVLGFCVNGANYADVGPFCRRSFGMLLAAFLVTMIDIVVATFMFPWHTDPLISFFGLLCGGLAASFPCGIFWVLGFGDAKLFTRRIKKPAPKRY